MCESRLSRLTIDHREIVDSCRSEILEPSLTFSGQTSESRLFQGSPTPNPVHGVLVEPHSQFPIPHDMESSCEIEGRLQSELGWSLSLVLHEVMDRLQNLVVPFPPILRPERVLDQVDPDQLLDPDAGRMDQSQLSPPQNREMIHP